MTETLTKPKERQPWERHPREPAAAFARFCEYLHLGPGRSIDAAYAATRSRTQQDGGEPGERASGQWFADSAKYKWPDRARAYDVSRIAEQGADILANFLAALRLVSEKSLQALKDYKPESVKDAQDGLNILGKYLDGESIKTIQEQMRDQTRGNGAAE